MWNLSGNGEIKTGTETDGGQFTYEEAEARDSGERGGDGGGGEPEDAREVAGHHVGGHLHRVLRQAHRGHRQSHAPDLAALLSQVRPPPRAVAVVTVLLLPAVPRRHPLLQKRRTLPHGGHRRGRLVALLSPQPQNSSSLSRSRVGICDSRVFRCCAAPFLMKTDSPRPLSANGIPGI
jgi:hypothetical protein